ncbi:MAG: glycerol-3-phosphate dehydrogenase subunit GlpB [Arcanobacterium sp.]|nr:glycerol-3-phosphate dehydrogenase subunit GlpB [Arcanobacterium sp.]
MSRIVVIGAGLAGLTSALMLAERGHQVRIVTYGWGGLLLSKGTVDVLGWNTQREHLPTRAPATEILPAFTEFVNTHPDHPYAHIGAHHVLAGVQWLVHKLPFFSPQELTVVAEREERTALANKLLPTAIGAVQPSACVPTSMTASVLANGKRYLVVGIDNLKDFYPQLVADNLNASPYVQVHARAAHIKLPLRHAETDTTGTTIARCLDKEWGTADFDALLDQLKGLAHEGETVLLPGVLGLKPDTFTALREQLGTPVGEIPLPPPSVPGRRINDFLVHACREMRVDIMLNAGAVGVTTDSSPAAHTQGAPATDEATPQLVTAVAVRVAGAVKQLPVDAVIYAGGSFDAGALERDSFGTIRELLCDIPVWSPEGEIFGSGVRVDSAMRPLGNTADGVPGAPIFSNLYCAGSIIGGALPWNEGSGEGIALGSAAAAVEALDSFIAARQSTSAQQPAASTKENH